MQRTLFVELPYQGNFAMLRASFSSSMGKQGNAWFCDKHSGWYHGLFNDMALLLSRPVTSHHVFCFGSFKAVIFSVRVSTPTVSI